MKRSQIKWLVTLEVIVVIGVALYETCTYHSCDRYSFLFLELPQWSLVFMFSTGFLLVGSAIFTSAFHLHDNQRMKGARNRFLLGVLLISVVIIAHGVSQLLPKVGDGFATVS